MKKSFLLLLMFITYCQVIKAQSPVIDSSWLPSAGDKYYTYKIFQPPQGRISDTGMNITWDYNDSFSLEQFPGDSFDFTDPAARGITCANSNSNLANGDSRFYQCLIKNDSGVFETGSRENSGSASFGTLSLFYFNPELIFINNFHFRDSTADTSKSQYNYSSEHTDSDTKEIKIKKWNYDGYGTLKFGDLIFNNVLRIHKHIYQLDSTYVSGLYYKSLATAEVYEWYNISFHVTLLTLSKYTLKPNDIRYYGKYNGPDTLGRTGIGGAPEFYGSKIYFANGNIIIIGIIDPQLKCGLYDAAGRLMFEGIPQNMGNGNWTIKISKIPEGVYLLQITTKAGKQGSLKFVKATQR